MKYIGSLCILKLSFTFVVIILQCFHQCCILWDITEHKQPHWKHLHKLLDISHYWKCCLCCQLATYKVVSSTHSHLLHNDVLWSHADDHPACAWRSLPCVHYLQLRRCCLLRVNTFSRYVCGGADVSLRSKDGCLLCFWGHLPVFHGADPHCGQEHGPRRHYYSVTLRHRHLSIHPPSWQVFFVSFFLLVAPTHRVCFTR